MDLIHRAAKFTIIAACGNDPTYGLPGVGHRLRDAQANAEIMHHLLVSSLSDPWEVIKASKWKTRAWTYQEAIFSTKCLFFTDQQASFECHNMYCCEAVDMCPESLHRVRKTKKYIDPRRVYAKFKGLEGGAANLKSHISE
jgi:Heterokaryon incompatibility protein (HET)